MFGVVEFIVVCVLFGGGLFGGLGNMMGGFMGVMVVLGELNKVGLGMSEI